MAAYTFTPSTVLQSGAAQVGIAGAAIVAGEFLYQHTDTKLYKAEAGDTVVKSRVVGIAVNSAAVGQPVGYVASGEITVDAAAFASVAIPLVLAVTAGKCMPVADQGLDEYLTLIGWSTAVNKFMLRIVATNVATPVA